MSKSCVVRFSAHAEKRLKQRARTIKKLTPRMVRQKLMGMLPLGLQVYGLAVEIPVGKNIYAVCVPELHGGWTVVTFKKGAGPKIV